MPNRRKATLMSTGTVALAVSGVGFERLSGSTLTAVRDPIAVFLDALSNTVRADPARPVSK
jgi:hypothetical protein